MRATCLTLLLLLFANFASGQRFNVADDTRFDSPWRNLRNRTELAKVIVVASFEKQEPAIWNTKTQAYQGFLHTVRVLNYIKGQGPERIKVRVTGMSGRGERVPPRPGEIGLYFLVNSDDQFEPQSPAYGFSRGEMAMHAGPNSESYRFRGPDRIPLTAYAVRGRDPLVMVMNLFVDNLDPQESFRSLEPLGSYFDVSRGFGESGRDEFARKIEVVRWFSALKQLYKPRTPLEEIECGLVQLSAGIRKGAPRLADLLVKHPSFGTVVDLYAPVPQGEFRNTMAGLTLLDTEERDRLVARGPVSLARSILQAESRVFSYDYSRLRDRSLIVAALERLGRSEGFDADLREHLWIASQVEVDRSGLEELVKELQTPPALDSDVSLSSAPAPSDRSWRERGFGVTSTLVGRIESIEPNGRPLMAKVSVVKWLAGSGPSKIEIAIGDEVAARLRQDPLRAKALQPGTLGLWSLLGVPGDKELAHASEVLALPEGVDMVNLSGNDKWDVAQICARASKSDRRYMMTALSIYPSARNAHEAAAILRWARTMLSRFKPADQWEAHAALSYGVRLGWDQLSEPLLRLFENLVAQGSGNPGSYMLDLRTAPEFMRKADTEVLAKTLPSIPRSGVPEKLVYEALIRRTGESDALDKAIAKYLCELFSVKEAPSSSESLRNLRLLGELRF